MPSNKLTEVLCVFLAIVFPMVAPLAYGETENVDYDRLLKQCDIGTGCCKASVDRMRASNAILKTAEKCPSGYIPNMLKCITSYQWCEPYTGRCIGENQAGKCILWQPTPVP